jgi:hypothetical protein
MNLQIKACRNGGRGTEVIKKKRILDYNSKEEKIFFRSIVSGDKKPNS